ncbi:MAG: hypothetical protein DRP56_10875 [Planctomycetota bacterium]|nr:MAG: hypothetical protein DRP56_10875 [Planctomycetota bacterium]
MNRIQKQSWLTVACFSVALILSVIAVVILYSRSGFPVANAGLGFLGFTGFAGLGSFIFKKDPGAVSFDERDHLINLKAVRAGFGLSYGIFIASCMGVYTYCKTQSIEVISIETLPMFIWPPFIAVFLGHAVATLILYGKDNKQSEGGAA